MAQIAGPAYTGQLGCDLSALKSVLVDLAPGALRGARHEQEGITAVLEELGRVMPEHGEQAEVRAKVYQRVVAASTSLEQLKQHEIVLEKLLEAVRETKGMLMNNREHDVNSIAARAVDTAKRQNKPALLAQFEKTIAYRAQAARKAIATRKKKNAAAEASQPTS